MHQQLKKSFVKLSPPDYDVKNLVGRSLTSSEVLSQSVKFVNSLEKKSLYKKKKSEKIKEAFQRQHYSCPGLPFGILLYNCFLNLR